MLLSDGKLTNASRVKILAVAITFISDPRSVCDIGPVNLFPCEILLFTPTVGATQFLFPSPPPYVDII